MASRPPEVDDIVVQARPRNTAREVIAYIPQIGQLTSVGALNYDLALSEEVTHNNEFTRHPIEDPQRSFIYDHNREEPTEISLSLLVSADPLVTGGDSLRLRGVDRLTRFTEALLGMRAAQSVDTSAYLDVFTGLRVYHNMGIQSITFKRVPESPNTLEATMSLIEFRFARPPRSESQQYLIDANDGPRSTANTELVTEIDRPIVEATRVRAIPRTAIPSTQTATAIMMSLDKLSPEVLASLGINKSLNITTTDELSLILLDDTPSQQYTIRVSDRSYDVNFSFNQLAGRWSFSAALTGEACPVIGGRFIEPGFNLFEQLSADQLLVPLDRPGITTSGLDWYSRLTVPLSDGTPPTMLVMGSVTAFTSLFSRRTALPC